MTHREHINNLLERHAHNDTMRPLSPLEAEQLRDYNRHLESLTFEQRRRFLYAEIINKKT